MTQYQHVQLIFDAAIAAHSTACRACRDGRRAGVDDATRSANRARRRAAHAAVRAAYDALRAAPII